MMYIFIAQNLGFLIKGLQAAKNNPDTPWRNPNPIGRF